MTTSRERQAHAVRGRGWGAVGRDSQARYAKPNPTGRRRCFYCAQQDHQTRASHIGFANGVALMNGCEFHVIQWVRYGVPAEPKGSP